MDLRVDSKTPTGENRTCSFQAMGFNFLGVDSWSILSNHCSFRKPAVSMGFRRFSGKKKPLFPKVQGPDGNWKAPVVGGLSHGVSYYATGARSIHCVGAQLKLHRASATTPGDGCRQGLGQAILSLVHLEGSVDLT